MYQLYYCPGACSMAVHIALLECGQKPELVKVELGGKSAELLKVNPRGQVPVLVDDGEVILEGAAMLIHLLEKQKSPLLPTSGKARTDALQWLMFCNATLHPAYSRVFFLKRNGPEDATKNELMETCVKAINKLWGDVENQLGKTAYLAGDQITMADILMTVIANWGQNVPKPITLGAKTKKLIQTVIARPSYKQALEIEHVEYKAAA